MQNMAYIIASHCGGASTAKLYLISHKGKSTLDEAPPSPIIARLLVLSLRFPATIPHLTSSHLLAQKLMIL